jgi:hypothetical protein
MTLQPFFRPLSCVLFCCNLHSCILQSVIGLSREENPQKISVILAAGPPNLSFWQNIKNTGC